MDSVDEGDEPTGRAAELASLHAFGRRVLAGHGGGLAVVGEHGVGKSALVAALRPPAGLRILRGRALPDDGPLELLARILGKLSTSLDHVNGTDLVVIADAALQAIATEVRLGPALWIVDDLDLVGPSTRRLIGYLVRRIGHLRAGMVLVGWRRGESLPAGVAVVRIHPLPPRETAHVVRARIGELAPDWVVDQLAAAAGGNPLAAAELVAELSPDEAAGRSEMPTPPRIGPRWTERWRRAAAGLGEEARIAMLVLAAGDGSTVAVLDRACAVLGLSPGTVSALETQRLARVDDAGRGWARRPHRSAVYHAATTEERRAVHTALAEAVRGVRATDAATRLHETRHHAAAAEVPDEGAGRRLEAALREVSASPEAVGDWIRAAELTESGVDRTRRLVSAALCSWQVGRPAQAAALVARAGTAKDRLVAGTAALVRGAVALSHGLPVDALRVLDEGARVAADLEPSLTVDLAARAAGLAWWAGRIDWAERAVELAALAGAEGQYTAVVQEATAAGAGVIRGVYSPSVGVLRQVLRDAENLTEPRQLLFASEVAGLVGDDLGVRRFHDRAVQVMRVKGRLTELPFALQLGALVLAAQGRAEAARSSAQEGLVLAARAGEESGGVFQHVVLAHVDALEGNVEACDARRSAVERLAADQRSASLGWALGRLAVSQSRFVDAVDILLPEVLGNDRHPMICLVATPDLVEAAVATGRREVAEEALERFVRWRSAGSPWACAVEPRLHALLAAADEAEEQYVSACRAPGLAYRPLEAARTRLTYGLFLRGRRRRAEAREQLHIALGLFESLVLPGWSARTREALRASGEAASTGDRQVSPLTPQELQIARMVSDGHSNREVASRLHLSSRTVDYHLSKIYVKLGLSSRDQLARALAEIS